MLNKISGSGVPARDFIPSCSSFVIVIVIALILGAAFPPSRAQAQAPTTASASATSPAPPPPADAAPAPRTPVFQGAPAETSYQPETAYAPWLSQFGPLPRTTTDTQATTLVTVDRSVAGVRLRGTLIYQPHQRPNAALLIVPEWNGLNPTIKNEADWWARKGFRVFVFDLYDGAPVRSRADADRLMKRLDAQRAIPPLQAALALLAGAPDAPTSAPLPLIPASFKTGVLAFGVGAVLAQRLVAADPRPAALAFFWGEPVKDPAVLAKIKIPILAIFAGRDAWVTPEKIDAFRKAVTAPPVPPETVTLMALPGFLFNTGDPINRGYAETARQRTLAFFTRELTE